MYNEIMEITSLPAFVFCADVESYENIETVVIN